MKAAILLLAGLCAAAHGSSAQFERANPGECVADGESVDLVELVSALTDTVACGPAASCTATVLEARDFTIEYFPGYKIVSNTQATPGFTSVLYPCGTPLPDAEDFADRQTDGAGIGFFEIPLTAVATDDSTAGWALEYLGVADRVRFTSAFSTAPCLQLIATAEADGGCGRLFAGPGNFAGLPPTPSEEYDAEFLFGSPSDGAKQIPFTASADPTPLGRAEHIVYLAAFFNKEAAASRLLQGIITNYRALQAPAPKHAPVVAWVSFSGGDSIFGFELDGEPLPGPGYIFSYARYKTTLTEDAGAKLVAPERVASIAYGGANVTRAADSEERGREIAFSAAALGGERELRRALRRVLKKVDLLIDETFTMPDGLAGLVDTYQLPTKESNQRKFPFLRNGAVYRHDKAQTPSGADDWFGQAVIRPDVVLKDLRAALDPCAFPDYDKVFLRNIAEGEETVVMGPDACEGLTCDSFAEQVPLPIEGLVDDADDSDVDDSEEVPDGDMGGPAGPVGDAGNGGTDEAGSCPIKGKKGNGNGNGHGNKKKGQGKPKKKHHK